MSEIESLHQKVDLLLNREAAKAERIPLPDFQKEWGISRPTVYAWGDRGLIKLEKVHGRQYVLASSITVNKKYQRA